MSLTWLILVIGPLLAGLGLTRVAPPLRAAGLLSIVPLHAAILIAQPGGAEVGGEILRLDGIGRLTLLGFDLVLAGVALRLPPWRAARPGPPDEHVEPTLALLLASVSLVALAHDVGVLWVGLILVGLSAAPLVAWRQHRRAVEAAWRLALVILLGLGAVLVGITAVAHAVNASSLGFSSLIREADASSAWLETGLALMTLGLLPMVGAAPVQGWRLVMAQDAPAPAAAVVSAGLTGAGMIALTRVVGLAAVMDTSTSVSSLLLGAALISLGLGVVGLAADDRPLRLIGWLAVVQVGLALLALGVGAPGAACLQGAQRDLLLAALWLGIPAGAGTTAGWMRRPILVLCVLGLAGLGTGGASVYAVLAALRGDSPSWLTVVFVTLVLASAAVTVVRALPRLAALATSAHDLEMPVSSAALLALAGAAGSWLPWSIRQLLDLPR